VPTPAFYTLSLHDALPICCCGFTIFTEIEWRMEHGRSYETLEDAMPDHHRSKRSFLQTAGLSSLALTGGLIVPLESALITSAARSEEHTSELQSLAYLVCR